MADAKGPKDQHIFKAESRFSDVISLYNFDRELRVLVFDAIEKIEISLRTKLIYHLSHEFGPWWFQNLDIYQDVPQAVKTLAVLEEEIERSKDVFIKEHNKKHKDDKRFPPSWKTLELTSFGALSRIYGKHLCCIKYILNIVQPQNHLTSQLVELFRKYPTVDPNALGMKKSWEDEELWR